VTVRFGPPVTYQHNGETVTTGACADPPGAAGPVSRELEQAELRSLTDALMSEIARLSGQEYVHRYATRAGAR
jgi:hypothetical protein